MLTPENCFEYLRYFIWQRSHGSVYAQNKMGRIGLGYAFDEDIKSRLLLHFRGATTHDINYAQAYLAGEILFNRGKLSEYVNQDCQHYWRINWHFWLADFLKRIRPSAAVVTKSPGTCVSDVVESMADGERYKTWLDIVAGEWPITAAELARLSGQYVEMMERSLSWDCINPAVKDTEKHYEFLPAFKNGPREPWYPQAIGAIAAKFIYLAERSERTCRDVIWNNISRCTAHMARGILQRLPANADCRTMPGYDTYLTLRDWRHRVLQYDINLATAVRDFCQATALGEMRNTATDSRWQPVSVVSPQSVGDVVRLGRPGPGLRLQDLTANTTWAQWTDRTGQHGGAITSINLGGVTIPLDIANELLGQNQQREQARQSASVTTLIDFGLAVDVALKESKRAGDLGDYENCVNMMLVPGPSGLKLMVAGYSDHWAVSRGFSGGLPSSCLYVPVSHIEWILERLRKIARGDNNAKVYFDGKMIRLEGSENEFVLGNVIYGSVHLPISNGDFFGSGDGSKYVSLDRRALASWHRSIDGRIVSNDLSMLVTGKTGRMFLETSLSDSPIYLGSIPSVIVENNLDADAVLRIHKDWFFLPGLEHLRATMSCGFVYCGALGRRYVGKCDSNIENYMKAFTPEPMGEVVPVNRVAKRKIKIPKFQAE